MSRLSLSSRQPTPPPAPLDADQRVWWGERALPPDEAHFWRIGPLHLWVLRGDLEWRLAWLRDDSAPPELVDAQPAPDGFPDDEREGLQAARFGVASAEGPLTVAPRLPDRPMVIRPLTPLTLPEGERVTLFVSSPLFLELSVGAPARKLVEVPTVRPTDTWFGSPIDGEICYASRTHGYRHLSELPMFPHRAITPVHVVNATREPLAIDRFSLPVVHLSLYFGADGHHWTQEVTVTREAGTSVGRVQLGSGAPEAAGDPGQVHRVAEPRVPSPGYFGARVFSSIFGR